MIRSLKIAVVSPNAFRGDEEYKNAKMAVEYANKAANKGAKLVCFPEGYPGPSSGPMNSGGNLSKSPIEMMRDSAMYHGIYISCGNLEESLEIKGAYYLCHKIISPKGEILENYKRCQPTPPVLNANLYNEDRRHILPGNELSVVDTEIGKIGIIICSELYVPELTRVKMLMGANIILNPIGGSTGKYKAQPYDRKGNIVRGSKINMFRSIAQCRAAENIVYVIGSANIWFDGSPWGSYVASPEEMIAGLDGEGIAYATLDMERLNYLKRSWIEDDLKAPLDLGEYRPILCQPGQNRDRRPELYSKLVEAQADAFNFSYYIKGREFS